MLLVVKKGYADHKRPDMQVSCEKIPAYPSVNPINELMHTAMDLALKGYYPNWYTNFDQIRLYEPKTGIWAYSVYLDPAKEVKVQKDAYTDNTYHVVTENGTFLIIGETMTVCSNFIEAYNNGVVCSGELSETDEILV